MNLFSDLKQLDRLVEEGKLNPIYLDEELQDLITVIPTQVLTQRLFKYSLAKLELSQEQIEALISDIKVLKVYNLWDAKIEQHTLEKCKHRMIEQEHYRRLSPSDKAKYDEAFKRQLEIELK